MENGRLKLDPDVLAGAEEAFRELRYVEAFALLQALIDMQMTFICQVNREMNAGEHPEVVHFGKEVWSFPKLRTYLLSRKIISKDLADQLSKSYELRNRIIHRLVFYSYQDYPQNIITQMEAVDGFSSGKRQFKLLEEISDRV